MIRERNSVAERILSVVTEEPRAARRIARLAGTSYNSYFYKVLKELWAAGEIERTPGGYRAAGGGRMSGESDHSG